MKNTDKNISIYDKLLIFVKKAGLELKNMVFPPEVTCDMCKRELVAKTRYPLCSHCIVEMPFVNGQQCVVCGTPITGEGDYCDRCKSTKMWFEWNRSPLVYDGLAKKMVLDFKYQNKRYLSHTLGKMMVDKFLEENANIDLICYVPMTKKEKKQRGFNQSLLMAKDISSRLKIPYADILCKDRETKVQKKLNAKERAENLKNAFSVQNNILCVDKNILLIDDVFTTGSTSNECSKMLIKAKAKKVYVLTSAVTKQIMFME